MSRHIVLRLSSVLSVEASVSVLRAAGAELATTHVAERRGVDPVL
jgi:hypothetical protein